MKVLLFGASGQLGRELTLALQDDAHVELLAADRAQADFADLQALRQAVEESRAEVVINAAAYTAVDQAESEAEAALTINGAAPAAIAEACRQSDTRLIHYSTDYVFDGAKRAPYVETDAVAPLNVYGKTKFKGDQGVISSGARHVIVRVGWVYSPFGRNFFLNVLRRARAGTALRIVDDQIGIPTSADAIAAVTAQILHRPDLEGLYHYAPAGQCSWYEFARQIVARAEINAQITPIATSEYPTPAKRPVNSVMSSAKLRSALPIADESWEEQLERNVERLAASVQV
jgi:dTDP-4-dehydrorhamnose reductase